MISVNGRKFVRNNAEAIDTLFHNDGTFHGFYRASKRGVLLSDMQNKGRVFIVNNPGEYPYPVTVTTTDRGLLYYMQALTEADSKWSGFDGISYAAGIAECKRIIDAVIA